MPSYQVPENSGLIEICVEVTGGSVIQGQIVTVTFSTSDSSAQRKLYSVSHILSSLIKPCIYIIVAIACSSVCTV